MKSLSLSGVSFYPDDTIEMVRQLLALKEESHPDRMFVEVRVQLPADHYSSNPLNWTALFIGCPPMERRSRKRRCECM